jgi:hypothetical protein
MKLPDAIPIVSPDDCGYNVGMQVEQLYGYWDLVSLVATTPDGQQVLPMGPHPKGLGYYGADGIVMAILTAGDRPPFSSLVIANRTPDEAIRGFDTSLSYYGTYTVHVERMEVIHKIERCSFPNLEGREMKRTVEIDGDRMVLRADILVPRPDAPQGVWAQSLNVWNRRRP